ncbi:MAG: hypothetical protein M9921_06960 [Fimbriimonadaceae bacterium]|nr:hypothetical protein [Chthonomonadaceae bacterium]MCO5296578.1 hypothetical protein [Fimbriimonadaceae bacterium]
MILFSSRKLESVLANGELGPWDKARYAIIPSVLGALGGLSYLVRPAFGQHTPAEVALVGSTCQVLAAILAYHGFKRCFETNQSFGGESFLERFTILLLPPLLITGIIGISLSLTVIGIAATLRQGVPEAGVWAGGTVAVMNPLFVWVLYRMLDCSFERLGTRLRGD